MQDTGLLEGGAALWWSIALIALTVLAVAIIFFWMKGRRQRGRHVFRASRLSRGNFLFPTQVIVSESSVLHFTPEIVGGREQSIHIHHISSVLVDRNLFFSDVVIETSGGARPVRCHGHRKGDAVAMKKLIEQYQSEYYRRRTGPDDRIERS